MACPCCLWLGWLTDCVFASCCCGWLPLLCVLSRPSLPPCPWPVVPNALQTTHRNHVFRFSCAFAAVVLARGLCGGVHVLANRCTCPPIHLPPLPVLSLTWCDRVMLVSCSVRRWPLFRLLPQRHCLLVELRLPAMTTSLPLSTHGSTSACLAPWMPRGMLWLYVLPSLLLCGAVSCKNGSARPPQLLGPGRSPQSVLCCRHSVRRGHQVYTQVCAACHRYDRILMLP